MGVNCSQCNSKAQTGDDYCRFCGDELPDEEILTCDCGAVIALEDKFCHSCGNQFDGSIEEVSEEELEAEMAKDDSEEEDDDDEDEDDDTEEESIQQPQQF